MAQQHTSHGSIASYTIGFVLSLGLTYLAYLAATNRIWDGWSLTFGLMGLAALQLMVQLIFFLHLGRGADKRWSASTFWFALLTIGIIAIGSLWIMHNMNYNMMSPEVMNEHMMVEREKGF